jgi:hypothetical protein
MEENQSKHTPLECMVKSFKKGFNGDYGVKLTPNKLNILCNLDWPAFGVRWTPKGSLDKTVVNEFQKVIVEKKEKPSTQENGKSQEGKTGLQKSDFFVYFSSGCNLLGRLRRNQSLSVLMGSFGTPVCTSSPKMGIVKED